MFKYRLVKGQSSVLIVACTGKFPEKCCSFASCLHMTRDENETGSSPWYSLLVAGCISGLSTAQLAIACDESPNAVPLAISLDSEL